MAAPYSSVVHKRIMTEWKLGVLGCSETMGQEQQTA